MASYVEMHKIANDPQAVRSLADALLETSRGELNDWELDFLESMSQFKGDLPLTLRQCEKLFEIRDAVQEITSYEGFSIRNLIEQCWLRNFELEENDADFIKKLQEAGASTIKRRHLGRLLRCSRAVGAVEDYIRRAG